MLLFPAVGSRAQYFNSGADPSHLRWSHIQVGNYNLVFPAKSLDMAAKFGCVLNAIGPVTNTMQTRIRPLPLILHPYAAFSNGTSVLAPRRIELFPKQPIALETNDFIPQLVIHEMRHFAQMERLNTGFTRWAGYLLGDQAQAIVLGIHVPKWLLEGDAVLTETLLSDAGRGRMANFIQPLRSKLISGKDLYYDRVMLGTYQDILPNEYLFGYFLAARGRMLSDPMLWSDALGEIGRNPFNVNGLSGITSPKTGFRFSKLLVETLEWLRDYWTDPAHLEKAPDALRVLVSDSSLYQNYFRPQRMEGSSVICLKKSINNLPAFVAVDESGTEKLITRPGSIEDAGFSYRDGRLIWAELIRDPRWENRSWSDIFSFDLKNNRKKRLTHGKRLFSPEFNVKGNRIAAISEEPDGSSCVRILDGTDGHLMTTVLAAKNEHFSYLCWGGRPDELWAITTGQTGRKIVRVILNGQPPEVYFDGGQLDITCPVYHEDWLYFCGPSGTAQGLYRMNCRNGRTEHLFGHPHGVNYLSASGEDLLLSVYSADGYRPAFIPFAAMKGKQVTGIDPIDEPVTDIIQRGPEEFPIDIEFRGDQFKPARYSKAAHLLRFHSWSPVFVDPDAYRVSPGVVLMTQNDLGTLTGWTGYQWEKTDRTNNLVASLKYDGLYPSLKVDLNSKFFTADTGELVRDYPEGYRHGYRQTARFGASLPLRLSSGAWSRAFEPGIFYAVEKFAYKGFPPLTTKTTSSAGVSLYASIVRNLSYRDLFPKWGFSFRGSWFRYFADGAKANNLTGRLMLYLPGMLPNSSLRILNSSNLISFGQNYSVQDFPRGQVIYNALSSYNLKIDYSLPVSYPDYHVSWLIYIKRIKANLFFDAGTPLEEINWFFSTGLDVTFDFNLLRMGIGMESGLRLMYFPTTRKPGIEFLYSFSVN